MTWPAGLAEAGMPATPTSTGGISCMCWLHPMTCRPPRAWLTPTMASGRPPRRCCTAPPQGCRAQAWVALAHKGSAGRQFEAFVDELGATLAPPDRRDEPTGSARWVRCASGWRRSSIRLKDQLGLERHGSHTIQGVWTRIAPRLLALAAAVWFNWQLGIAESAAWSPTRAMILCWVRRHDSDSGLVEAEGAVLMARMAQTGGCDGGELVQGSVGPYRQLRL
jgi:hypothetical protein